MYSDEDIKVFFSKRGEIEMEIGIFRARYHNRENSMPPIVQERINQLERDLMIIDSMFCALSSNERFIIQLHVIEQLDWAQVMVEFVKRWGSDSEKTIRSLQVCQAKALKKVADAMNKIFDSACINIESQWDRHR